MKVGETLHGEVRDNGLLATTATNCPWGRKTGSSIVKLKCLMVDVGSNPTSNTQKNQSPPKTTQNKLHMSFTGGVESFLYKIKVKNPNSKQPNNQ